MLKANTHTHAHSIETKQASEAVSDMVEILELWHQDFEITMINMAKALMGKNGQHSRTDE